MYSKVNPKSFVLIFVMSISLIFLSGASQPQEDSESLDKQPSYIDEMVESSQLTQSQVDNMKNGGESWGNIRITASMAEQIAAKNSDSEKTAEQKYQEALNYVSQQRAAGKGYGTIANENNINLGSVMGNGNGSQNQQKDKTQLQNQNKEKKQSGDSEQPKAKTKKKGLVGRFFGMFKKENKAQKQEPSSQTQTKKNVSNKEQTQNASSSQKLKTQKSTETVQKEQQKTRTEGVGNTSGNQGNGNSRGGGRGK